MSQPIFRLPLRSPSSGRGCAGHLPSRAAPFGCRSYLTPGGENLTRTNTAAKCEGTAILSYSFGKRSPCTASVPASYDSSSLPISSFHRAICSATASGHLARHVPERVPIQDATAVLRRPFDQLANGQIGRTYCQSIGCKRRLTTHHLKQRVAGRARGTRAVTDGTGAAPPGVLPKEAHG